MIPIKREAMLLGPSNIQPTSKRFQVIGAFNPAAARLPNGDIVLYVRIAEKLLKDEDRNYYYAPRCIGEDSCKMEFDRFHKKEVQSKSNSDLIFGDNTKRLLFISHFRRVILDRSGFKVKHIDPKPSFTGLRSNGELGVEDPRMVKLGDRYAMTYVSLSRQGNISTSLALSEDGIHWDRKGVIFSEQNKDVVLFPEMIKGNYHILNRPEGGFEFTPPHMWMATSKDLLNWGKNRPVKLSKRGGWDYERVGAGAPPIKTDKGWLLFYHGVETHEAKVKVSHTFLGSEVKPYIYTAYEIGAALFDLKNPRRLIAKAPKPIIYPRKKYEISGYVNHVIFPEGLIYDEERGELLLFSGGGDSVTEVKKIALKDVMDSLEPVGRA